MTRFEEIQNAAQDYGGVELDYWDNLVETDKTIGFVVGAKWADKHPKSPWIKCSERLPEFINGEENQYYYDTKLQKILTCKWEVSDRVFVVYSDGGVNINYFQHNLMTDEGEVVKDEYSWLNKLDVVAWMAIPKFEEE